MSYDHHQEEIELRWQHAHHRLGDEVGPYETDYDTQLSTSSKTTKPESSQLQQKMGFWLWIWVSPVRFTHFLTMLCIFGLTTIFMLESDGILHVSIASERVLMVLSTIFGVLSIAWITGFAIAWRKYKFRQD